MKVNVLIKIVPKCIKCKVNVSIFKSGLPTKNGIKKKDLIYLFRKGEREDDRERETDELSHTPLTEEDLASNPGMCPDRIELVSFHFAG